MIHSFSHTLPMSTPMSNATSIARRPRAAAFSERTAQNDGQNNPNGAGVSNQRKEFPEQIGCAAAQVGGNFI